MASTIIKRFATWLYRMAEGKTPPGFVVPWGFMGSGTGSARKYRDYITDGFHGNPIIYACLNIIARTTATVDLAIAVNGDIIEPEDVPKELQPLQSLIERPNPNQALKEFIEEWSINQNVGGSAYVHCIGIGTQRIGEYERTLTAPEMWLIRPDRVELLMEGPLVVGFRIDSKRNYTTEEMFYTAFPTGMNDSEGLSPLKAAARSGDAHSAAIKWNERLLKNMGVPSGIVAFKGLSSMSDTKMDEFMDKYQQRYGGPEHAGKTAGIPADGVDYIQLAQSAKDMDWLGGKQDFMRDICAAMGVPSILLGDPNSRTFSNYREGRKALYLEKVLPDMHHFESELNHYIDPRFKPGVEIVLVTDHIDVLRQDQDALVTRLKTADWMTPNEKRREMGLEDIKGGDILFVPFNLMPISVVAGGAGKASEGTRESRSISKASLYQTEEQRQAAFNRFDGARRLYEKRYEGKIREYLSGQVDLIAERLIEDTNERSAEEKRDVPGNFVQLEFDFDLEAEQYMELMKDLQLAITVEFGQAAINQLIAEGVIFDIERPALVQFIANDLAARSRLINQTTATQMQSIINAGVTENEGIFKIRDRLLDQFGDLSVARARTIAQTEVGRAASQATIEGFKQMNVEQKEWLSARDANVRDAHMSMDGQLVGMNDNFISPTGGTGPGPGMLGTAEDDINCRCVMVPLRVGEDKI